MPDGTDTTIWIAWLVSLVLAWVGGVAIGLSLASYYGVCL